VVDLPHRNVDPVEPREVLGGKKANTHAKVLILWPTIVLNSETAMKLNS